MRRIAALALLATATAACSNPDTPAGYVGYVTRGAWVGRTRFYGLQTGPTSTGLGWLLRVENVSVTPYTYHEEFAGENAVLSKDNLQVAFRVHLVFRIRPDRVRDFIEQYSTLGEGDDVVRTAYDNFLREPLRTFARDEVQRYDGLAIKDNIEKIGRSISDRTLALTGDTPFEVRSVVVGNVQYPAVVATAVASKMAATQLLEQRKTEIEIARREKEKRVVEAEGIAKATEIIQSQLTAEYLQHEAIEAQKMSVNSPNHTVLYIPVGEMGVPLVRTLEGTGGK